MELLRNCSTTFAPVDLSLVDCVKFAAVVVEQQQQLRIAILFPSIQQLGTQDDVGVFMVGAHGNVSWELSYTASALELGDPLLMNRLLVLFTRDTSGQTTRLALVMVHTKCVCLLFNHVILFTQTTLAAVEIVAAVRRWAFGYLFATSSFPSSLAQQTRFALCLCLWRL